MPDVYIIVSEEELGSKHGNTTFRACFQSVSRSCQALWSSGDRQLSVHILNSLGYLPDGSAPSRLATILHTNINTAILLASSHLYNMDLRSILNFDGGLTRPSQSFRKNARSSQVRSSTGKTPIRTVTSPIKIETTWSGPSTPIYSPKHGIYPVEVPWTQDQSPIDSTMRHSIDDKRTFSGHGPRISTSSTAKRRASVYSAASYSSSACSSPSPATPSSMTSAGTSFRPISSSKTAQYQTNPNSNMSRQDHSETSVRYHVVGKY